MRCWQYYNRINSRNASPLIQARQHDTKCRSLGFNPGTEGYKQCRLRLKMYGSHDLLPGEPETSMSMNGPGCAFAISAYFHTHAHLLPATLANRRGRGIKAHSLGQFGWLSATAHLRCRQAIVAEY